VEWADRRHLRRQVRFGIKAPRVLERLEATAARARAREEQFAYEQSLRRC
jgi:hypothetical protein